MDSYVARSVRRTIAPFALAAALTSPVLGQAAAPTSPVIGQADSVSSLGFGIGIGNAWLEHQNVRTTSITNGVVRITDAERTQRAFWLESHYLLDRFMPGNAKYASHGPFLAGQFNGENGIFDALAFGYMFSLKRTPRKDQTSNAAFNIGVGYISTKVQRLGDGVAENATLPVGEESVRLRGRDSGGVLLLFSFNFLSVAKTDAAK